MGILYENTIKKQQVNVVNKLENVWKRERKKGKYFCRAADTHWYRTHPTIHIIAAKYEYVHRYSDTVTQLYYTQLHFEQLIQLCNGVNDIICSFGSHMLLRWTLNMFRAYTLKQTILIQITKNIEKDPNFALVYLWQWSIQRKSLICFFFFSFLVSTIGFALYFFWLAKILINAHTSEYWNFVLWYRSYPSFFFFTYVRD